jgi:hypothetical protein
MDKASTPTHLLQKHSVILFRQTYLYLRNNNKNMRKIQIKSAVSTA